MNLLLRIPSSYLIWWRSHASTGLTFGEQVTAKNIDDRITRAKAYLGKVSPAIEGSGGDDATFKAACIIVNDFSLSEDEAHEAMQEWNRRCVPPWDDGALREKICNAIAYSRGEPGSKLQAVGSAVATGDSAYEGWGNDKLLAHCLPVLNQGFVLLRATDGTERLFSVNKRKEAALVLKESLLIKTLHDALKAQFGEIPPDSVLTRAIKLWKREAKPIPAEPVAFCFKGDDRLCFTRFDWEPELGEAPAWEEFLSRLTDRAAFMAFVWSCFDPDSESRQFVWLRGEGQDGKSVVLRTIQNVFGSAATGISNTHLKSGNQFTASVFYGKRVVVYPDCKNAKVGMSEVIRNITSGDPMVIEFKGEHLFSAVIRVKLFIASNPKPEFSSMKSDTSRMIYIEVAASKNTDDPSWAKRLESELPAFLHACRAVYERVCPHHGDIPVSDTTRQLQETATASFEERFHDVWDANFVEAEGAKVQARYVTDRLKEAGLTNNDVADFKQWMHRTHDVTFNRSNSERFYTGLAFRRDAHRQAA